MRASSPASWKDALQSRLDAYLQSGRYESEGDVIEAAFEALAREEHEADARDEALHGEIVRRRLRTADDRPDTPLADVFDRLDRQYEPVWAKAERGS